MVWEQTIIIESKKENTFIISNDNHNTIINVTEENKIKVKKAYLINRNIRIASYTHTNKSHKRKICKKHVTHNNYHCNEKRRNKLSLRNTTQTCDKYDVRYAQEKYKAIDNYNCKYNGKPYSEYYYKRRMKKTVDSCL